MSFDGSFKLNPKPFFYKWSKNIFAKIDSFFTNFTLTNLWLYIQQTFLGKAKATTRVIMVILLSCLLVLSFIFVNLFGYYSDFKQCQNVRTIAVENNLPNFVDNCEISLVDRFWYLFSDHKVSLRAQENLSRSQKFLELQITQEKAHQEELKTSLDLLQVKYSSFNYNLTNQRLQDKLAIEQAITTELIELYEINKNKPADILNNLVSLVKQFDQLELSAFPTQITKYSSYSLDEKIENFDEIVLLQNDIKTQIVNNFKLKYPNSTATQEQLFSYSYYSALNFKEIFDKSKLQYDNTIKTSDQTVITQNIDVDNYMYKLGLSRGYEITPQTNELTLIGVDGFMLQPPAALAWDQMRSEALNDGVNLSLVSGYRSLAVQKQLFWSRFVQYSLSQYGVEYLYEDILSGKADQALDELMQGTAPPGYSRHHTGYTIDIRDNQKPNFLTFKETPGYTWISANNYFNAKRFGFIPSYPEGGQKMGPNPEAWEYVWVGKSNLL